MPTALADAVAERDSRWLIGMTVARHHPVASAFVWAGPQLQGHLAPALRSAARRYIKASRANARRLGGWDHPHLPRPAFFEAGFQHRALEVA